MKIINAGDDPEWEYISTAAREVRGPTEIPGNYHKPERESVVFNRIPRKKEPRKMDRKKLKAARKKALRHKKRR